MPFSLLANICAISTLDLEHFFNHSGYPPSLGVVTVGNRPVPLPHRTFVRIGMFPFPCHAAAVRTSFPITAAYQIRLLFPSSRLLHHPAL